MTDQDEPRKPKPLGAHNDLTHPGGPLRPLSPPPGPLAPPRGRGDVGLGVALAFAWALASFAALTGVGGLVNVAYRAAYPLLSLAIVVGLLVAIHVFAIRSDRAKVLVAFWTTVALLLLAFVVTCFALVFAALG